MCVLGYVGRYDVMGLLIGLVVSVVNGMLCWLFGLMSE